MVAGPQGSGSDSVAEPAAAFAEEGEAEQKKEAIWFLLPFLKGRENIPACWEKGLGVAGVGRQPAQPK